MSIIDALDAAEQAAVARGYTKGFADGRAAADGTDEVWGEYDAAAATSGARAAAWAEGFEAGYEAGAAAEPDYSVVADAYRNGAADSRTIPAADAAQCVAAFEQAVLAYAVCAPASAENLATATDEVRRARAALLVLLGRTG